MNILWIAALSLLVGVEKLLPRGFWFSSAGVILTAWGAWLIAGSFGLRHRVGLSVSSIGRSAFAPPSSCFPKRA